MFQITFKILNWIRPYKARMILGFSMSFLNAIFIALPIFLAAKIFNNVLSHKPIYMKDILNVCNYHGFISDWTIYYSIFQKQKP